MTAQKAASHPQWHLCPRGIDFSLCLRQVGVLVLIGLLLICCMDRYARQDAIKQAVD